MAKTSPKPAEMPAARASPPAEGVTFDDGIDYVPRTDFGRRLLEIRRRIIASGGALRSRQELEREIAERRGGWYGCDERDDR